jgi:hypothetical protein
MERENFALSGLDSTENHALEYSIVKILFPMEFAHSVLQGILCRAEFALILVPRAHQESMEFAPDVNLDSFSTASHAFRISSCRRGVLCSISQGADVSFAMRDSKYSEDFAKGSMKSH